MTITFSNPRLRAEFEDWPLGGNKRGRCVFEVEHHPKRGYRAGRTTTGKTKWDTFSGPCCIVDGSDGRTYILRHITIYGTIDVRRSDFMNPDKNHLGFDHWVSADTKPELFRELFALIVAANPTAFTNS